MYWQMNCPKLISAIQTFTVSFEQVQDNQSDAIIVTAAQQPKAQQNNLVPIVYEKMDDYFVIVTKKGISEDVLKKMSM